MDYYNYRKLEWDTKYFRCKSSRVDVLGKLTLSHIQEIKGLIKEDQFITFTNPKGMIGNSKLIIQELGAYLVDINVQLSNVKVNSNIYQKNKFIHIKNNYNGNEEILELVGQTFTNSRFYNDTLISRENASGIYINWVRDALNKKEKYFCLFNQGQNTVGFILFSITNQKIITIELMTVGDKWRKSGVGTQLISGLYYYCIEHGYETVNVGTQLENINALNFYTKNGLKIKDIRYVYHLWNKER